MKECKKCKEIKAYEFFWKHKSTLDGYNSWCKKCYRPNSSNESVFDKPGRPRSKKGKYFPFDYQSLWDLYKSAARRSNIKNREFDLTIDDIYFLFLEFSKSHYFETSTRSPFQLSLDRIDNSKGYTKDNVRVCWLIENFCKNSFSEEQVIEFCKRKLDLI